MSSHYPLSYQVTTVHFNGKFVTKLPDESYVPTFRLLQSLGVNEVMLSGYVTVEDADFDMSEETKRLGGLLNSMGMKPAQHHGLSALYAPLDRSQAPVIEKLKSAIRYTANLGAPALVLHPGHYYAPDYWNKRTLIEVFEEECQKHGVDAVLDTVINNLREVADTAKEYHVKIALENVDRFEPMGSPILLPRIVNGVSSPAVGYCLDSGHAHCCGMCSVLDWIANDGDKLFTTHFHDNRGVRGVALSDATWISVSGIDEHRAPGFGTIPWIDVIKALHKIGYSNTVNFESAGWQFMDAREGYQSAISYWRTCESIAWEEL